MSDFDAVLELAGWSRETLLAALSPPDGRKHKKKHSAVIDLSATPSPLAGQEKRKSLMCSPCTTPEVVQAAKKVVLKPSPNLLNRAEPFPLECKFSLLSLHGTDDSSERKENINLNIPKDVKLTASRFESAKAVVSRESCPLNLTTSKIYSDDVTVSDATILSNADLNTPLPNGWILYEHQRQAVESCIRERRAILAYDMGLGKTIICLLWARALSRSFPDFLIIVIAPCTLLENWRREARMIGFSVEASREFRQNRIVFYSWAKIPEISEIIAKHMSFSQNFAVICDEAHAMQSLKSTRTQATLSLCLSPRCKGVLLATGTPMKNGRPANIYPLLVAIKHDVARNKIEFERRYCNAKKTKFCPWDISGATNLMELRNIIGSKLLRKKKEECIKDIAQLQRLKLNVAVQDEDLQLYNELVQKIKNSSTRGRIVNGGSNTSRCALDVLSEMRQIMSLAKVVPTSRHILELLREDRSPIVVFAWFRETVVKLVEILSKLKVGESSSSGLKCASITGDITDQLERQLIVDRFQEGRVDALVCTYGVGSTGLTLTRSYRVVLLDRPWTPGDVMQAEDRVRRIGQMSPIVKSTWICAFSFDEKLDLLLQNKDKQSCQVIEGSKTASLQFASKKASTKQTSIIQFTGGKIGSFLSTIADEDAKDADAEDLWNVSRNTYDDGDDKDFLASKKAEKSTNGIMSCVLKSLLATV